MPTATFPPPVRPLGSSSGTVAEQCPALPVHQEARKPTINARTRFGDGVSLNPNCLNLNFVKYSGATVLLT